MSGEGHDYKLDISSLSREPSEDAGKPRDFIGVHFKCCGIYQRIYKTADGTRYDGRCPRCLRSVRFLVGSGGTDDRMFVVE